MNSRDSFSGRKFKNRAPTSCSPGPILSLTTISFELHAKAAEEIDLEKCNVCKFVSLKLDVKRVMPNIPPHQNHIATIRCDVSLIIVRDSGCFCFFSSHITVSQECGKLATRFMKSDGLFYYRSARNLLLSLSMNDF